MSIELSPDVANLVHGLFSTGKFASEEEVLSVAVRLLHERQQLRESLEQGIRELDGGQRLGADVVFADLKARAMEFDGNGS